MEILVTGATGFLASNLAGDKLVQRMIARDGLPAVISRPEAMFGDNDRINFRRLEIPSRRGYRYADPHSWKQTVNSFRALIDELQDGARVCDATQHASYSAAGADNL
jgi:hypothetical protein